MDIIDFKARRKKLNNRKLIEHLGKKLGTIIIFSALSLAIYSFFNIETAPLLDAPDPSTSTTEEGKNQTTVGSDSQGHFLFIGNINGKPVKFLYDTGATFITIPIQLSEYLSDVAMGEKIKTQTANGTSISYLSILKTVSVGNLELNNVPAAFSIGFEGDVILLGMSFTKHFEVVQTEGKLIFTEHAKR